MRRAGLLAVIATGVASLPLIARLTEERNVRVLASHVGCSQDDARRLYRLARRDGYGAAYAQVFPGRSIPAIPPFDHEGAPSTRRSAS